MAIKKVGQEPAKPAVKRVVPKSSGDGISKEELLDELCVFTVRSYDPEYDGKFGIQPKVVVDVIVLWAESEPQRFTDCWYFGNLAKQIGENLDRLETGTGRVIKGKSNGGNEFWGVDWATEAEDFEAAEKAIAEFAPAPY